MLSFFFFFSRNVLEMGRTNRWSNSKWPVTSECMCVSHRLNQVINSFCLYKLCERSYARAYKQTPFRIGRKRCGWTRVIYSEKCKNSDTSKIKWWWPVCESKMSNETHYTTITTCLKWNFCLFKDICSCYHINSITKTVSIDMLILAIRATKHQVTMSCEGEKNGVREHKISVDIWTCM